MSALDKLRSFAQSVEPDDVPIRAGLTYGDVRHLITIIDRKERVECGAYDDLYEINERLSQVLHALLCETKM